MVCYQLNLESSSCNWQTSNRIFISTIRKTLTLSLINSYNSRFSNSWMTRTAIIMYPQLDLVYRPRQFQRVQEPIKWSLLFPLWISLARRCPFQQVKASFITFIIFQSWKVIVQLMYFCPVPNAYSSGQNHIDIPQLKFNPAVNNGKQTKFFFLLYKRDII